MNDEGLYVGREQTLLKHFILRKYLERFAHIIGSRWDSITYVDCFSGPWNVRSPEFRDSSFAIALEELRKARQTHRQRGRDVTLRCFFLEKHPEAYARLREFADQVEDVEVRTRNLELESAIGDILDFVRAGGRTFPFIFIDPTGWKGLDLALIRPLLQLDPGEVLINYMTDFRRRFEAKEAVARMQEQGLSVQDREDALFTDYAEEVRRAGRFRYTCAAFILYPDLERSYFHLIYATRHRKGVEVFKDVEKKALPVMEGTRADAQRRQRERKSSQQELFASDVLYRSSRVESLRDRYCESTRGQVEQMLRLRGSIDYDEVWDTALAAPLVWESDLKGWIGEWSKSGQLQVDGMIGGQRVPKLGVGNKLCWRPARS